TATARDGAWDVLIPVNATRSVVLKAADQVDYYCKFHPNMTGQISLSKFNARMLSGARNCAPEICRRGAALPGRCRARGRPTGAIAPARRAPPSLGRPGKELAPE